MPKLRAVVVGLTGVGNAHTTGLATLTEEVELVAGCDLSEKARQDYVQKWKETWPGVRGYASSVEMFEKEHPDLVTVATSDHRHAEIVVQAARAGAKGIFCEKPLATSLEDADRMVQAAEASGTWLSVDHTRRWQPIWVKTRQVIQAGAIGPVQYAIGTLGGPRAMLFRNGTHLVDMLVYFAESLPEWVSASLERGYEGYGEYRGDGGHDPKTEPAATGFIQFQNGVRGFYAGLKGTPSRFDLEIVGSSACIRISDSKAQIHTEDRVEDLQPEVWPHSGISEGVRELVRVLRNGGDLASPGRTAIQTVEIMIGFLESQRQNNARVAIPVPRRPR